MRTSSVPARSSRRRPLWSTSRRASPASPPLLAFLLPTALLCASCGGGGLNPVQGKVLHKGQPAKGAVVVFHPKEDRGLETVRPTGVTGEDGSFTLSDHTGQKGVTAGTYTVTITWPEPPKPPGKGKLMGTSSESETLPDRLGGRYADRAQSQIVVEVKSGDNQLEPFDLR